jgi:hypothetical protein
LLLEAEGVLIFVSGKEAEQITIRLGAQGFGSVAVVVQAVVGEDERLVPASFFCASAKAVESGQRHAKATVQLTQSVKQFGFLMRVVWLRVRAAARALGSRLRQRIGAGSFVRSHVASY